MTTLGARVLIALSAASLAGPAVAQLASGAPSVQAPPAVFLQQLSRGESPPPKDPPELIKQKLVDEQAGKVRATFIRCMYQRNRAKADALLHASDPIQVDFTALGYTQEQLGDRFKLAECLTKAGQHGDGYTAMSIRMDARSLRPMMAEAAYLDHHPQPPGTLETIPEAPAVNYVSSGQDLAYATALHEFGMCVVRTDPRRSDAFLRTIAGSPTERAALNALAPAIPNCVAAGQKLTLNRKALREFVADGLWTAFDAAGAVS